MPAATSNRKPPRLLLSVPGAFQRARTLFDWVPGTRPSAAFLPHRDLVPQEHEMPVRITQLGAVAPEALLRWTDERDAGRRQPAVRVLDVSDLEGEDDPIGGHVAGSLVEEEGEASVVLQGDRPAGRDL